MWVCSGRWICPSTPVWCSWTSASPEPTRTTVRRRTRSVPAAADTQSMSTTVRRVVPNYRFRPLKSSCCTCRVPAGQPADAAGDVRRRQDVEGQGRGGASRARTVLSLKSLTGSTWRRRLNSKLMTLLHSPLASMQAQHCTIPLWSYCSEAFPAPLETWLPYRPNSNGAQCHLTLLQAARDEGFNFRFSGISFSGNEGWIIGKPAILLHTTDGAERAALSQTNEMVGAKLPNVWLVAHRSGAAYATPSFEDDAWLMQNRRTMSGSWPRRRRELGAGAAEREAAGQPDVHPRAGRQDRPGRDGD